MRIVTLLLSLLLLSSCTKSRQAHLLLDWQPNPNHIPLFVGKELGFFRDVGIEFTILKAQEVSSGLHLASLGSVDYVVTYQHSFVKAKQLGLPLVPCGILIESPLEGLLFIQDGTIETPKDLSGKRLGYAVNATRQRMEALLQINQITPQHLYNCHFDLVGMMASGQVDVLFGAYATIEGAQLEQLGWKVGHFPLDTLGFPTFYELIVVAKEPHPRFGEALAQSIAWCQAHPDEALTIYFSLFPEKTETTKRWEERAWEKTRLHLATSQHYDTSLEEELKNALISSTETPSATTHSFCSSP